jgi:hypothetical protein
MDGWWRDIGDDGDEDLQIPVPAGCQNGVSGFESRFLMAATQRKSIWEKRRTPAPFRSEGICRRKEGSRRRPRRPHNRWAWPGLGCAPLVVWWPPGPSPSRLLALWVFWWNRIFAIFSQIFTESWISAQKRDTRAILLKTTLVRVSCIENTQIRGETIAKVFGKVDTFWTYQYSTLYSLRQELPCILCLVKVKFFKFWPNILVKLSINMKPNTCNMKIYFMKILMMVISYYKY